MNALDARRRAAMRLAYRAMGVPEYERVWAAQARLSGSEAEVLRLPVNATSGAALQDAGGAPLWMFGLSSWASDDPFS